MFENHPLGAQLEVILRAHRDAADRFLRYELTRRGIDADVVAEVARDFTSAPIPQIRAELSSRGVDLVAFDEVRDEYQQRMSGHGGS